MTREWLRSVTIFSMLAAAGCDANDFAQFGHDAGTDDGGGGGSDDGSMSGGEDAGPPPKRVCGTDFKFHPAAPVTSVGIGAEFDAWKPEVQPMTGPDGNGDYTATVMLAP